MNPLQEKTIQCPYCWESINILVDCSVEAQEYIEDCEVCCQPIQIQVRLIGEETDIQANRDGE